MPFRIFVADDHEIVRRGLCSLLESRSGWEICGEAGNGRDAVEKVDQLKPDLVILDLYMPMLDGLSAAHQILRNDTRPKILVLSVADSEQMVREVLEAGARGFVLKSDAARDLVAAVEALQAGRTFFTSRIGEMVLEGYRHQTGDLSHKKLILPALTPRERETVQLLAEGKRTKEVARIFNLSAKTVETHRYNIMRKLKIHTIGELVLYAVRNNIVHIEALQTRILAQESAAGGMKR